MGCEGEVSRSCCRSCHCYWCFCATAVAICSRACDVHCVLLPDRSFTESLQQKSDQLSREASLRVEEKQAVSEDVTRLRAEVESGKAALAALQSKLEVRGFRYCVRDGGAG